MGGVFITKRHYIIYEYLFPNGKRYIGKTCRTMAQRQGAEMERYKKCTLLYNAIQKYGVNNIRTIILYEGVISAERSSEIEKFYIAFFKTNVNRYGTSYGYNLTDGGEGVSGWVPSPERLIVLQNQMRENGHKHRGTKLSEDHKEKLRIAKMGKPGIKHSAESRHKASETMKRVSRTSEAFKRAAEAKKKKVYILDLITNEVFEFNSYQEAASDMGVAASIISRWLQGTRDPSNRFIKVFNYPPTTTERERLCVGVVSNSLDTSDTALMELVREGQW